MIGIANHAIHSLNPTSNNLATKWAGAFRYSQTRPRNDFPSMLPTAGSQNGDAITQPTPKPTAEYRNTVLLFWFTSIAPEKGSPAFTSRLAFESNMSLKVCQAAFC